MASKDNQSLQILVITLVIVGLLLSVGLVLVNNQRKAETARAVTATQSASEARTAEREAQEEMSQYKQWMGFQEADNFETLQKSFADDMALYGKDFDDNSKFYRKVLEGLFAEYNNLVAGESAAKLQIKKLDERILAVEAEKNAQITEYEDQMKNARTELAKARQDFLDEMKRINEQKQQLASDINQKQTDIDQLTTKNAAEQIVLSDKITKLERATEILQSNKADPDPFAQPADGLIRWVNQRNGTVWINIGEADELRPQVTFSVYDGDENDALGAERKGSIEVTRILSDHMAEARITDDQNTRPLLAGDKVYSQVWNRGRQVGFAITGVIDFDKDGLSDLDELKQIISINKGKVDAVPSEEGTIEGQMSVDTRYLILGKLPDGARQTGLLSAWSSMNDEADTLGVEAITLEEFLSLMGWRSERHTTKLGTGADADDFKARPPEQKVPSTIPAKNDLFRRRSPQAN